MDYGLIITHLFAVVKYFFNMRSISHLTNTNSNDILFNMVKNPDICPKVKKYSSYISEETNKRGDQMTDRELIELFFARDERALVHMQRIYGSYCLTVANNILENYQDAEECVNDAYLRVWNSIPPQRPDNFSAFAAKIVRNLSLDRLKRSRAGKRSGATVALEELEGCLFTSSDTLAENVAETELRRAINVYLRKCSERDRAVFIRRYFFTESLETIAKNFDLSYANTSKILARMRTGLKEFLKKEGFYL